MCYVQRAYRVSNCIQRWIVGAVATVHQLDVVAGVRRDRLTIKVRVSRA
jgi:hypothetical protein